MKKKYQVFVSSTFLDLKPERQAAVEAILLAGHIPAGMELFSAGDESQLEVIKKWIEASDIYMVILGARYGSIEAKSGLSYIELEYNHATLLKKPLFALVLDSNAIEKKRQQDTAFVESAEPEKLHRFREKVLSKISRSVEDHKDVKLYTMEAIKKIEEERAELLGWVRADEAVDTAPVLEQITALTKSNGELRGRIKELESLVPIQPLLPDLAGLDEEISIRSVYKPEFRSQERQRDFKITIGAVFALIAPKLMEHPSDEGVKHYLALQLFESANLDVYSREVNEQDFQTIKVQLSALNLVNVKYTSTTKGGAGLFWFLTEEGNAELIRRRAIRRPANRK
jgi:hypothetical protein